MKTGSVGLRVYFNNRYVNNIKNSYLFYTEQKVLWHNIKVYRR